MKKQLLFKLSEKTDLDESVILEDEEECEINKSNTKILEESKVNKTKLKYKLSIRQNSFNVNKHNNNASSSNESMVSLEVNGINSAFLKRFASKISEPTLTKFKEVKIEEGLLSLNIPMHNINKEENFKKYESLKSKKDYENSKEIIIEENSTSELKFEVEKSNTFNNTYKNKINLENLHSTNEGSNERRQSTIIQALTLPKKQEHKKIFEEFLTIGIEPNGLEYITDHDELYLTPKILFNYPNKLLENELKFNIKFLKNFCFNEGVKVQKINLSHEDDFIQNVLERNFFSKNKLSFCLVQQITTEDVQKYFIFGIKFDDFYITESKCENHSQNTKTLFIYEKTFLFIAHEPLCKLFENIFQHILNIKKLNFLKNLDNFEALFSDKSKELFEKENNEMIGEQISEILQYFHFKFFPKHEEYIGYKSEINHIFFNYYHPNKHNEEFLATEWLSKIFFKIVDTHFYTILTRILLEQSFIFIADDIQNLTTLVLGFSYLIKPFSWPFILIPNLPLDLLSMVESPVPFLLGILGDKNFKYNIINNPNISANIAIYTDNHFELILKEKINCEEPYLKNLKHIINNNLSMAKYYINNKKVEEYEKYCEIIYKNIYETYKTELADEFEKELINAYNNNNNMNLSEHVTSYNTLEISDINMMGNNDTFYNINQTNTINLNPFNSPNSHKKYTHNFDTKDQSFINAFLQTQIFQCFCEEIRKREFEDPDDEDYYY